MAKETKKVLIVEDDKDFLWLLRQSFEQAGLVVVYALDGQAGIEEAVKENPDLIIADILMPGMDGIEMARNIKEKGSHAKMIFLTNLRDPEHVSEVISSVGETDYIVKSDVHIDQIISRVKDKLGIKA